MDILEIQSLEDKLQDYNKAFKISSGIYYDLTNRLCVPENAGSMIPLFNVSYKNEINIKQKNILSELTKFKDIFYQVYDIIAHSPKK